MAATDANLALNELTNSLDLTKVPDKLHCPGCNKFLSNAFKTPCCDQAICEACQSSITDQCPVCDHSPLHPDLCKPSKAVRTTAKAYLKTAEKKLADERAKTGATANPTAPPAVHEEGEPSLRNGDEAEAEGKAIPHNEVGQDTSDQIQPSIETPSQTGVSGNVKGFPVDSERSQSTAEGLTKEAFEESVTGQSEKQQLDPAGLGDNDISNKQEGAATRSNYNSSDMSNMVGMSPGLTNSMDYNQMMQFMSGNMGGGMGNFNPMMGMSSMGMNPMPGMFGNMGSPGMGMAGVNGMNMGMNVNFNPNQGAYGGWNNGANMWNGPQNNNPNAFANGTGGEFGPNAGFSYNMSPAGNFHQQQYPNSDFQSGHYGRGFFRGRGRGRGGFRGRAGGLNHHHHQFPGNVPHSHQQPYEQQQAQIQQLQAGLGNTQNDHAASASSETKEAQLKSFHDELAPGGHEEVHEAFGMEPLKPGSEMPAVGEEEHHAEQPLEEASTQDKVHEAHDEADIRPVKALDVDVLVEPLQANAKGPPAQEQPSAGAELAEAYKGALGTSPVMPPPTAPLGPAAHFPEPCRDSSSRGRGPGRFAGRGRLTVHLPNGLHSSSSSKGTPELPLRTPTEPKGPGIVGAPTGPKAMRAPGTTPTGPRGRGGFQIVGRAAMMNQRKGSFSHDSEARTTEHGAEERSHSPLAHHHEERTGHSHSYSNAGAESDAERRTRHEHRHRRSRRDDYPDEEMLADAGHQDSRSSTPASKRNPSQRSRDRDDVGSGSKHRSSRRSRHQRGEEREESSYDNEPSSDRRSGRNSRDVAAEMESRSSGHRERHRHHHHHHRSGRSSRHDDRDRDREADPDRDERQRRRKRSRRERDEDGIGELDDPDGAESRHRSRRHKREHDYGQDASRNGTTNGRGSSHHYHHNETPTTATATTSTTSKTVAIAPAQADKDMHTLEREARNKERLLKEEQRREKAEKGRQDKGGAGMTVKGSGSRRTSYKYEDEVNDRMMESERARDQWR